MNNTMTAESKAPGAAAAKKEFKGTERSFPMTGQFGSVMMRSVKDPITGKHHFAHTGNSNLIVTSDAHGADAVMDAQLSKSVKGVIHLITKSRDKGNKSRKYSDK